MDGVGIEFTGLKPGEKMYEELFYETDDIEATSHPMITVSRHNFAAAYRSIGMGTASSPYETGLSIDVDTLIEAAAQGNLESAHAIIRRIVPQYTPATEYVAEQEETTAIHPVLRPVNSPGIAVNG